MYQTVGVAAAGRGGGEGEGRTRRTRRGSDDEPYFISACARSCRSAVPLLPAGGGGGDVLGVAPRHTHTHCGYERDIGD